MRKPNVLWQSGSALNERPPVMMWHALQKSAWHPSAKSALSLPLSASQKVVNLNSRKYIVSIGFANFFSLKQNQFVIHTYNPPALSHFFFLSRPCNLPWRHRGNKGLSCPECLFMMWLVTDSHFASFKSPSSSSVDAAHQYMWLTTLFFHFETTSQSFFLARLSIFLPIPKAMLVGIRIDNLKPCLKTACHYIN